MNRARPGRPGRRRRRGLLPEQKEFVHEMLARAMVLGEAIGPFVRTAWREQYGTELPRSAFMYYAYSHKRAEHRRRHLRAVLSDPELVAMVTPAFAADRLRRAVDAGLEPRVVGVQEVRRTVKGRVQTETIEIRRCDLPAVLAAVAELRRWYALRYLSCPRCGALVAGPTRT